MTTREQLVEAVVCELRQRGAKAASHPVQTADAIADRLGLVAATADTVTPPAPETDTEPRGALCGAGIWVRLGSMPDAADVIEHLDYVVIPLHTGARGPVNLGPTSRAWIAEVLAGGVEVWAMDWLPRAGAGVVHLEELCAAALRLGCRGLMSDCEPDAGWRGRVREAVAYRAELARVRGPLDLAITDYARGGIGRRTLGALLAEVNGHRPIGVPQSYDPQGLYKADYHELSVAYWRELGADRVVLGAGAWLRGRKRHRTPAEMDRHLEHVPEGVQGVCAWYADADALDDGDADTADDLLPVLAAHRAA